MKKSVLLKVTILIVFIIVNTHPSYALRPQSNNQEIKQELDSWLAKNAPKLMDYSAVSWQLEAGLDRGLIEKLIAKYGPRQARSITQTTLTGGLGALMHDLPVSWKMNGLDITGINVIYEAIKGFTTHDVDLPKHMSFGDAVRQVLGAPIYQYVVRLEDELFINHANSQNAKDAMYKDIHVDWYMHATKYAEAPLFYASAYYLDGDRKVYIFNNTYPDNDMRWVHMAVYNEAGQLLVKALQRRGILKEKIISIENELFVSLPKNHFNKREFYRLEINHTVVEAGIPYPPSYAFNILGFREDSQNPRNDQSIYMDPHGNINLISYVAHEVDAIIGVSLAEHTDVLRNSLLARYADKVLEYNREGMRNTNGVLFEQWQGQEIRQLIEHFRKRLGLNRQEPDTIFYTRLQESVDLKQESVDCLEKIKALYVLDFLFWLNKTQQQEMGGATWLSMLINETEYGYQDLKAIRTHYRTLVANLEWGKIDTLYSDLIEELISMPMVSTLRRQVEYKGPGKYKEMLQMLSDPEKLEEFRSSGVRLVMGGRTFDESAYRLFDEIRSLAMQLDLKDRIAFTENYNFADAPIIFRAMSGAIMLSEELKEAASTAMMKVMCNAGSLIGVWGGADPELFVIYNKETKEIVDVLETGITHDEVVAGLDNELYEMLNGFLIKYEGTRDPNLSLASIASRKPSVHSLVENLKNLGHQYQSRNLRQKAMLQAIASSPKVDMEKSQARAQIMIMKKIAEDRERIMTLVALVDLKDPTVEDVLVKRENEFVWHNQQQQLSKEAGLKGLVGFLQSFKLKALNGRMGIEYLNMHLSNHIPQGDIIYHLQDLLSLSPALEPLLREINNIAQQTIAAGDDITEKRFLTLKALDFLEMVLDEIFYLTENNFKAYQLKDITEALASAA